MKTKFITVTSEDGKEETVRLTTTIKRPRELTAALRNLGDKISKETESEWRNRTSWRMSPCHHAERREDWQERIDTRIPAFTAYRPTGYSVFELVSTSMWWADNMAGILRQFVFGEGVQNEKA